MNKRSHLLFCTATLAAAVGLAGCSKPPEVAAAVPAASSALAQVPDLDVTEHVKTALQQNETLKGYDITVMTTNGDVRLSGMVDSQAQIDSATRIARASEGAHAVHDELTLKK
jgi:osmotically-inducible protein OsmY